MGQFLSRRRIIAITAAVGLELVPLARSGRASELVGWHGTILGAQASLQIHHPNRATAQRLASLAVEEARRLERIFSLYVADSSLVQLNRRSVLEAPPAELVDLLADCRRYRALTGGAFDPTVQPLWLLHLAHFSKPGFDPAGPSPADVGEALERVGLDKVLSSRDRIAFARRGMAITLNGIAQGYITDSIVALLRSHGISHTMVDMGEARVIGTRPDGEPWKVGIADPVRPGQTAAMLSIVDQAVATSAGYGFRFDEAGRFNHLFDPRSGRSAHRYSSVTVVVPTATAADALSTGFAFMPTEEIRPVLETLGGGQVHLQMQEGGQIAICV